MKWIKDKKNLVILALAVVLIAVLLYFIGGQYMLSIKQTWAQKGYDACVSEVEGLIASRQP